MTLTALLITVALLLVNGVFVAFEFALVAARQVRVEALAADGGRRARAALAALGQLSRQLAGVQLGVTLASLGLGAVGEPAIAHGLESLFGHVLGHGSASVLGFVIGLGLITLAHSVLGELVPRSLAMTSAEGTLLALAVPLRVVTWLFTPAITVLNLMAKGCLKMIGLELRDELASVRSIDEIGVLVAQAAEEGKLDAEGHRRMVGAIGIGARTVDQVMVPREQIVSLRRTSSVADAEARFVSYGLSRLPVIGRDIDDVLGFVHAKDLLEVGEADRHLPLPLRSIRRMLVVAEHRPLDELLVAMRRARLHAALVIDHAGRTVGMVTLEDVLEELVGDITDESDR